MRRGGGLGWGVCLVGLWLAACNTTLTSQDGPEHSSRRSSCQPMTCESQGLSCGVAIDGCGGTLHCGDCPEGQVCGGGGTPNVCSPPMCQPGTCKSMKKNCGDVPDGCGGTLHCGTCTAPETCGASGVSGVCYTSQPVCVDQELGSALPVTVKGTTAFSNNDHQASCGGNLAPDRGFLWTAPKSGTFIFDTTRSALRSLVAVRHGGCGGEELACATEGSSPGGGASVTVALEAGQTVLVVVDSPGASAFGSGYFELHIDEKRESEAGACFDGRDNDGDGGVDCADTPDCQGEPGCTGLGCANQELGSALPITTHGETVDSGDGFTGTCGPQLQQDRAHLWTAPKSGTFVFDTAGGGWSNALYVLASCRGAELACAVGSTGGTQAAVKVTLLQGQSVLVVVDGMANDDSEEPIRYTLHISEYMPTEAGHCEDGADNDADGATDHQDTDCR
ncbi:hypothetical protein [Hyalangium sp.]|uniref:hypothetical protein n=1 Tax=Hyalangium sp. TaxID=2028555 RepID=UPI002D59254D|nr:hypothetical protein [Hyalangium sp.]HYI02654.1 hypothetical protein [Hyalangium sp.]